MSTGISVLSFPLARKPSPPAPSCQPRVALASLPPLISNRNERSASRKSQHTAPLTAHARQAAVDRLPQQIGQRELLVQALSRVAQVFLDELLQTQWPMQLANQNQAAIGSHSRSLEIDLQGSIKRRGRLGRASQHSGSAERPK